MKHTTIALFVPHMGCPHRCSFCEQREISGETRQIQAEDVHDAVRIALKNPEIRQAEIAFFGGSFTAIDRRVMCELLAAAYAHIDGERISGIRISTRPDAVDDDVCLLLKRYGVHAAELGAQSMDDTVLRLNGRGHTAQDVTDAVQMLRRHGFEIGLQMMTGLYGADAQESVQTAQKIIALRPDTVRIYPTVVMKNTALARLYAEGRYRPQTTQEAAELRAALLPMFETAGVRVLRVGLHSGGGVENNLLAGAYHPAFKELCESKIYLNAIQKQLGAPGDYTVWVPQGALSQAIGQKKANKQTLLAAGYCCRFEQKKDLPKYQVLVKENRYDSEST